MGDSPLSNERCPLDVVLQLAQADFIAEIGRTLGEAGIVKAVIRHDSPTIFDWIVRLFPMQGISDAAAISFQREHGGITWADVEMGLAHRDLCPSLRSWWHFTCGYQKAARTCAMPDHLETCALPQHDLRKGVLNQAAYGLALFIRDICGGDLVAWIDGRLASAADGSDPSSYGRPVSVALVEPLAQIPGTGPKIWSMILADLLLSADPGRERWIATGASMIAIDSLVHAWLHRSGTIERHGAEHPYGPRCYQPNGCADVIERLAQTIDARTFNPHFPSYFPRFVQVAIWEFCAEGGRNICNGRQIEDRYGCRQVFCPAGARCARKPLKIV